ncbi:YceI family protein [Pontibacter beigongshangensis]|uniref:YceI family protein n=1 Tax=Pontibacter beigongshangensis TaxID=2574733 RepID=UPI001650BE38|nr:YceI family protein [Pontibacter beigongshangensis]
MRGKSRWEKVYGLMACMLLALQLAACDTTIKTDDAEVGEPLQSARPFASSEPMIIDTAQSQVTWIGSKMTGRHNGTICIETGELQLLQGRISGGHIVIDLTKLVCTDKNINAESSKKLATHLKSADFFDVENHPTATFEIVSVAPYDSLSRKEATPHTRANYSELKINSPTHTITGNLTIKGTARSISFPAKVRLEKDQLRAKANFNIDRTQWGLVYRSDESLGDKTIYSSVNIGFDIVARPASDDSLAESE